MIQSFKNMVPVVDPSAYVHPMAVVIGHVTIGPDCYIGPGAVLRGDWGKITLEPCCTCFPKMKCVSKKGHTLDTAR